MSMETRCLAPAKIILTGEHSVLNHVPALSLAIDLPTICEINFTQSNHADNFFDIELSNFQQRTALPFALWNNLAMEIESRFQQYQQKTQPIQMILQQPNDLIIICLYHFHQRYPMKKGHWHIKISGHNLLSRGLGSSASVIISLLVSLYHQTGEKIDNAELLDIAKTVESRQHGKSSGLDPATILFGGLIKYQIDQPIKELSSENFNAWLIDTGVAETSTGQAVIHVQNNFPAKHSIWQKFKGVSTQIETAWLAQDNTLLAQGIKQNQQLLETIGVVPDRVARFLNSLNKSQLSTGKICGSGAIAGDSAGVLLCIGDAPTTLCEEYGYQLQAIRINNKGTSCEMDV